MYFSCTPKKIRGQSNMIKIVRTIKVHRKDPWELESSLAGSSSSGLIIWDGRLVQGSPDEFCWKTKWSFVKLRQEASDLVRSVDWFSEIFWSASGMHTALAVFQFQKSSDESLRNRQYIFIDSSVTAHFKIWSELTEGEILRTYYIPQVPVGGGGGCHCTGLTRVCLSFLPCLLFCQMCSPIIFSIKMMCEE